MLGGKFAGRNITVNAILPGAFTSRMMRGTIAALGEDRLASTIPLGRLGGVFDMAGMALMMAGKSGAWMTGSCATLDGGAVVSAKL